MAGTSSVDNATNFKLLNQYGSFNAGLGNMFDVRTVYMQMYGALPQTPMLNFNNISTNGGALTSTYGNGASYTNGALNFGLNSTGGLNTGALNFGLNSTGNLNTGILQTFNPSTVTPTGTTTPTPTISVQQKLDMQNTIAKTTINTNAKKDQVKEVQQKVNTQTKPAGKKPGFFSKEFWKMGGEALKDFGCSLVCKKDANGKWKFDLGKTAFTIGVAAAAGVLLFVAAPALAGALAVSAPLISSAITVTTGTLIPAAGTCWSLWQLGKGAKDYIFNENMTAEQQKEAISAMFVNGALAGTSAIMGGVGNAMKVTKAGELATKLTPTVETAEKALTETAKLERIAKAVTEAQAAAKAASGLDADVEAITAAMKETFKLEAKAAEALKENIELLRSGNPKDMKSGIDGLKKLAESNDKVAELLENPKFAKLVGQTEPTNKPQASTPKNAAFARKILGKERVDGILAELNDIKAANPAEAGEIDDIAAKLNQATKPNDLPEALKQAMELVNKIGLKDNIKFYNIDKGLTQMTTHGSPTEFLTYTLPRGAFNLASTGANGIANGIVKFFGNPGQLTLGALTATGRAIVYTAPSTMKGLATYSKYTAAALAAAEQAQQQALIDGKQDAADQAIADVINTFSTELNTYNQYATAYGMETITNTIGSTDKDLGKIEEKINTMRSKMHDAIAKVATVA